MCIPWSSYVISDICGPGTLEDAAVVDGLWDSSSDCHLSACVERTMQARCDRVGHH